MPVATNGIEETTALLRQLRDTLKQPIQTTGQLMDALSSPLDLLGLLPEGSVSTSRESWTGPRGSDQREILLSRFTGSLQTAVLEHVIGAWWDIVEDEEESGPGARPLLEAWFCPLEPQDGWDDRRRQDAVRVAISSYQTLVAALHPTRPTGSSSDPSSSTPSSSRLASPSVLAFVLPLLAKLSTQFPLPSLYENLFRSSSHSSAAKSTVIWETLARTLVSVPAKVMNATEGGRRASVPRDLYQEIWYERMTVQMELIVRQEGARADPNATPLSNILQLFVRNGYVSPSSSPSLPSADRPTTFFASLLPHLLPHLSPSSLATPYSRHWRTLFNLLDFADLARLTESLLRHLLIGMPPGQEQRVGQILDLLVGRSDDSLWEKILLGPDAQGEPRAMVGVWWVAGGRARDQDALERLMQKTLALWTDMQFIKFSLVSRHVYVLALFLLLLKSFPPSSPPLRRVSTSASFLNALTHYLSHPDRTIRYLGMLGAEEVSARTTIEGVKTLDFGVWDGDEGGKAVAKKLRVIEIDWDVSPVNHGEDRLLGWGGSKLAKGSSPPESRVRPSSPKPSRPTPGESRRKSKKPSSTSAKITVLSDSDDSLTGYQSPSSSSSSRSDSPSPSDLDEYIEDPTLYAPKKKKVPRPVYLGQLADLLSATEEPEKLEVALKWGEALIRRKRGFGLELDENAIHLTLMIASLNNNFELDEFDDRKQGILNALVACSPEKAAPTLIEQYFHPQYSLVQRSALLTALAMGAREAASLPTIAAPSVPSVDWPSKKLPDHLHQRFVTQADTALARLEGTRRSRDAVQQLAAGLSEVAIGKGRESAEGKVEMFQREKRLRVASTTANRPSGLVGQESMPGTLDSTGSAPFKDTSAEFFILPLINRFWIHYQDEANKLARAPSYHAAGTGMVLSPLALSKFLATLSVLMHAARHSPLFLAVLAPEALELALRVGSRPPPATDAEEESTVLVAALELALVVLDASRDLDGGRTLVVNFTGLVLGVGEWGEVVFGRTEKGERVLGEGGEGEGRIRRASAGLVVVVGECREKWGRIVGY